MARRAASRRRLLPRRAGARSHGEAHAGRRRPRPGARPRRLGRRATAGVLPSRLFRRARLFTRARLFRPGRHRWAAAVLPPPLALLHRPRLFILPVLPLLLPLPLLPRLTL